MKAINLFLISIVASLLFICCGARKTKTVETSVVEKLEQIETDKTTEEIIETIKREIDIPADTITGTATLDNIRKPGGVIIENDNQKITVSYDEKTGSVILEGVQKAKKAIEEVRREIKKQNDITKTTASSTEAQTKKKETQRDARTGWNWFFIGIILTIGILLIWRFRKYIPFINKL